MVSCYSNSRHVESRIFPSAIETDDVAHFRNPTRKRGKYGCGEASSLTLRVTILRDCAACVCSYGILIFAILVTTKAQAQFPPFPFQTRTSQFVLKEEVQIEDVQSEAKKQLVNAQAYLASQKWDEAIETLRSVAENHGPEVIQTGERRYLTVRDYCHLQIAGLPREALALYRGRVDPVAEAWLKDGLAERDAERLDELVKTLFCSSYADDALDALGELALERGDFGRARAYWERISPRTRGPYGEPLWKAIIEADSLEKRDRLLAYLKQPSTETSWLAYPDSDLDLAQLRARLVLVSILEGALKRASLELEMFQSLHRQAEGRLAGQSGNLAERLQSLFEESRAWPVPATDENWTTFAGSPRRQQIGQASFAALGRPDWQIEFPRSSKPSDRSVSKSLLAPSRVLGKDDRLRAHPVVYENLVLFCTQNRIYAYDLETGKPAWSGDPAHPGQIYPGGSRDGQSTGRFPLFNPGRKQVGVARYTLTVHNGKLYARLGSSVTGRPSVEPGAANYLVCLDLQREGAELWRYPREDNLADFVEGKWAFEGPPVSDGQNVYAAMRRSDVQPQYHVACFDAQTGELRWRRFVCKADTPAHDMMKETTHNLLTLHEGMLYCNTNMGAVAAISAARGEVRWVYQYERAGGEYDYATPPAHFYRDLNPCIYYQGMVIAAPSDCEKVVALDAVTGDLLWYSAHGTLTATHPVHLLGVAQGHLIATGKNVWWIDVVTGKPVAIWPKYSRDLEEAYGRGVLSGEEIYWPTREEMIVFDQQPLGLDQPRILRRIRLARPDLELPLSGGNLIVARGHLLIATNDWLFGYQLERN